MKPPSSPNELAQYAMMIHDRLRYPVERYPADTVSFAAVLERAGIDPFSVPSDARTELHGLVRWLQSGLPVLRPSLDLATGLVLTDPSSVLGSEWKLPFNTFVIHVPYDIWLIEGGQVEYEGLEFNSDDTYVTMVVVHSYVTSDGTPSIEARAIARSGLGLFSRFPMPHFDEPLEDWLEATGTTFAADSPIPLVGGEAEKIVEIWRLVINTCLFVIDRGKGQSETRYSTKKARRRQQEKGALTGKPEVWILGKEIHLDRELLQAAKSRTTGRGWSIKSRSVVQGHFKEQPYGPGRLMRKRIWIEPYYRGPKEGERLSHLYTMGYEEDED